MEDLLADGKVRQAYKKLENLRGDLEAWGRAMIHIYIYVYMYKLQP